MDITMLRVAALVALGTSGVAMASDKVKVVYIESERPLAFKQLRTFGAVPLLKTSLPVGTWRSWNSGDPHHVAYFAVPANRVDAVKRSLAGRRRVDVMDQVLVGVDIRMADKKHQERFTVPVADLKDLKLNPAELTLKRGSSEARDLIRHAQVKKIRITSWKTASPAGGGIDGAVTLFPAK